jgi:formylglycine-generating enzyme required for sulfatase activity
VESDGVVDATCGGCLEGLVDAGDSCRAALDCSELDCETSNRECVESGEAGVDATCGDCRAGTVEIAGACVPPLDGCGPLAAPAFGEVDTPTGTGSGAQANYTCDAGRVLRGDATRTCQPNGTWSGAPPVCNGLASPCSTDTDCPARTWCPTNTYEHLRRCSPREFAGESMEMDFALVPAGTFLQGRPISNGDDAAFQSTLTRDYWVSTTEITQGQWKRATGGINPACFQTAGLASCSRDNANDNAPVETITWTSAALFANWMSEQAGLERCYISTFGACDSSVGLWAGGEHFCQYLDFTGQDCPGYRLLTEAEWERAARADREGIYVWGESDSPEVAALHAWYGANSNSRTSTVATLLPNPYGLFDMAGNVYEFVNDYVLYISGSLFDTFLVFYAYPTAPAADYVFLGPFGFRGARGGAFTSWLRDIESVQRGTENWTGRGAPSYGFRLARTVVR